MSFGATALSHRHRAAGKIGRAGWAGVLGGMLFGCIGCGGSAKDGTVSGTVRFKGEPLPLTTILFSCDEGKVVRTGTVQDGHYTVEKLPLGPAKIYFSNPASKFLGITVGAPRGKSSEKAPPAGSMSVDVIRLPKKYTDPRTSGQEYEVLPGAQTKDFDLQP